MTLTSTEKYHISTGTAPVFSPPPQTFWLLKHVNAFLNVSQGLKNQVKVKLSIVSCPPVTTVLIKRPDLKFQLGFSVQNGIVSAAVSLVTMTLNLRLNFQLRLIKCLGACRFFCYVIASQWWLLMLKIAIMSSAYVQIIAVSQKLRRHSALIVFELLHQGQDK